jgi:hypothetical protein
VAQQSQKSNVHLTFFYQTNYILSPELPPSHAAFFLPKVLLLEEKDGVPCAPSSANINAS